jgi:hypothetical protein
MRTNRIACQDMEFKLVRYDVPLSCIHVFGAPQDHASTLSRSTMTAMPAATRDPQPTCPAHLPAKVLSFQGLIAVPDGRTQ